MLVPADSVETVFREVNSILKDATPASWETTLWPGTPEDVRDLYEAMVRTVGTASVLPGAVSPGAAKAFIALAEKWGANYSTFIGNAIRGLEMLPEGARVELLTSD
ncbi:MULTISPECIES: hypothetical protein [Nocardia]|uniref:hypothetical protein n=1 Tax=Nocardia TaxID=1817 RepID=UPI0013593A87|nr:MULTISPECIES: hypothetical protein [Nocardia]